MNRRRACRSLAALAGVLLTATACSTSGSSKPVDTPRPTTSHLPTTSSVPSSLPAPSTTRPTTPARSTHPAPSTTHAAVPKTTTPPPPSHNAPVIVIDPGHSVSVHGTDKATGLDTSDYENEPEMRDVFDVAVRAKSALQAAGYKVYLTKSSVDDPTNLGDRAYLANGVHADLALSIHDQAGSNGGLAFSSSNNTVYYQAVGDYRVNPAGHKVYFTDSHVAAVSKKYGQIFQTERQAVEHHPVRLLDNTGYDLGARGLQAGDMWIVQLLSKVPWIYNEAGGNSAGMSGLNSSDRQTYADAIVAGVEHCIAPPR